MRADDLDFHLPPELIAQSPAGERAASRLLRYDRATRTISHAIFSDLPGFLRAGDLLVFNDARVIPARFTLQKNTGGKIEALFIGQIDADRWRVLLRNLGTYLDKPLRFAGDAGIGCVVRRHLGGGEYEIELDAPQSPAELLQRVGRMPLPPYIKREKDHDARDDFDRERYQTIYAKNSGAVAAPTAGLHFTSELMSRLNNAGVQTAFVTLHVGLGTFKGVEAEHLADHVMHSESYAIPRETADAINLARSEKRRVIAVGTTAARVLESQPAGQSIAPREDRTSIFIYPPYTWKFVDAMITNFHLPRSTLIALVAAMAGLDEQRRIYATAIAQRYRFFSYGDAMLIE